MACFERFLSTEVVANTTDEAVEASVTQGTISEEGETCDGCLVFEVGGVEVALKAVFITKADDKVIDWVDRSIKASSNEVGLIGQATAELRIGEVAVEVIVPDKSTESDFIQVVFAFDTNNEVIEISAGQTTCGQTKKTFGRAAGEEVSAVTINVGFSSAGIESIDLDTEALADWQRKGTADTASVGVIDRSIMEVDFTVHSRHRCIRDGTGSAFLNGWGSSS